MVRRFTILDHVTAVPNTSAFGLAELLQEIQDPPPPSRQRDSLLASRSRPPSATASQDDDDEDDMDQEEIYHRLLQHPDLQPIQRPPTITIDDEPPSPLDHNDMHDDDDIIVSNTASHRPFMQGATDQRQSAVRDQTKRSGSPPSPQGTPNETYGDHDQPRHPTPTESPLHDEALNRRRPLQSPAFPQGPPAHPGLSHDDYVAFYTKILRGKSKELVLGGADSLAELTSGWDDALAVSVLHRAWEIDRRGRETLDLNCFSASLFFFIEQWVDDTTLQEYQGVLQLVDDISNDHDFETERIKPTLHAYNQQHILQAELNAGGILLGKSIDFDAEAYVQSMASGAARPAVVPTPFFTDTGLRPIQSCDQIHIKVNDAKTMLTRRGSMPPPAKTRESAKLTAVKLHTAFSAPTLPVCRDKTVQVSPIKPQPILGKKIARKSLPPL
ncbi:hypothetical protein Ae201684P_014057 [Aphanomyces euteiches]|nr:hypothetical protein Ae201684P_014057 [Aphanomyces euteiches]